MPDSIEIKKTKIELHRVTAARLEMEMRIDQLEQEISRLKEHIAIQEQKENELTSKLKELE